MSSKDRIYLGLSMGNDESTNGHILVYSSNYELIKDIEIESDDCMMQSMALGQNDKFLICCFQEGNVAVVNTEDFTVQMSTPFGEVENIYNAKVLSNQNSVEFFERVVFATSDGCRTGMLSKEGFLQSENAYFEGCNVSNVERIAGDKVIVTYNCEEGYSKLFSIDTATDETEILINQHDRNNSFDIDALPGLEDQSFYMLHQAFGLHFVDGGRKRLYTLSYDKNDSYGVTRSLAMTLKDNSDPAQGFWLAWLDNSNNFAIEVRVYDFDAKYIQELNKLNQMVD